MKFYTTAAVAGFAAFAAASPAPSKALAERGTFCGQYDSEVTGAYTVYNNLWGESAATSGSQCTTNNGISDGALSWSTSWSWAGGNYNVKSFANVVVSSQQVAVSSISSIPTTWDWTYTGDGIVADVAYDMFTSSTAGGSAEYEIMVWLAAIGGAGPISATGSPIATPTIAGSSWNLSKGTNGAMTVFSFVASSEIGSFSADLLDFISYLESSQGLAGSQVLLSIGAGTEPFVGSDAVFTTSAYSVSVN